MDEGREELEQYRERVVAEVERRMIRLRELESDLEVATFTFEAAARSRSPLTGSTARNQVEAAHRARLKATIKRLSEERVEAETDLHRAQERLDEVDARIEQLNGGVIE